MDNIFFCAIFFCKRIWLCICIISRPIKICNTMWKQLFMKIHNLKIKICLSGSQSYTYISKKPHQCSRCYICIGNGWAKHNSNRIAASHIYIYRLKMQKVLVRSGIVNPISAIESGTHIVYIRTRCRCKVAHSHIAHKLCNTPNVSVILWVLWVFMRCERQYGQIENVNLAYNFWMQHIIEYMYMHFRRYFCVVENIGIHCWS